MPGPGPGPAPWAGAGGVARLPEALAGRSGRRLVRRIRRRLFVLLSLANVAGAAGVVATIIWALPGARIDDPSDAILVNGVLGALFLVLILPVGITWGELWLRSGRRWLQEERPPTEREVTAVLRAPVRLFLVHSTLWALATAAFTILNAWVEPGLMTRIGFTVGLGGLITSAFAYLLGERATRPLAAAALSIQSAARPRLPGVTTRALLGWALGTGVPLVGLTITAVFALTEGEVTARQLSVTVLVLSGTGLIVGMLAVVLSARAVAAPVASLRRGIGAVPTAISRRASRSTTAACSGCSKRGSTTWRSASRNASSSVTCTDARSARTWPAAP